MLRKRLLPLILALVLVLGVWMPGLAQVNGLVDLSGTLVILHTNDIHGRAIGDGQSIIGYAAIAQFKEDMLAQGASVLLLDAGDASQGTPIVNLSTGKTAMEFMNAAKYDAMSPGNHEFDWGSDNMLQNREVAQFPILAANIVDRLSREMIFTPHTVFEMPNGLKVGVFGLSTPETLTKTHPDKVKGIDILMKDDLYACAQAEVDALKAEGCDLIVCLGHLGVDAESEPNRSIDVIGKVTGIDLFIDGHSHTAYESGEQVNDTLLVSTGEYGARLGVVTYESETKALKAGLYQPNNPEVAAVVQAVNDDVTAALSEVFATTEVVLNGERDPGVRTMETNLGDFAADAILWAAQQATGESVVAAVTNGGGIRASINAGEITMNDMKTVFPFGNEVTTLTVTGAELLEALEAATCSTPEAIGAFPQVAGIEFTINTATAFEEGEAYPDSTYFAPKNPGSRVTIQTVGGQAFDPEALYTIATNDFTAAGGDTYYAFKYANQTSGYRTGVALEDALIDYVATVLGGVVGDQYAEPQGRIAIVSE